MSNVPLFSVRKFVFVQTLNIWRPKGVKTSENFNEVEDFSSKIPGYFFISTAPLNVEDSKRVIQSSADNLENAIDQIVEHLTKNQSNGEGDRPELILAIHGYNTIEKQAEDWYANIYNYINSDEAIKNKRNTLFIGYHWPSENIEFRWLRAILALPILPYILLSLGLILAISSLIFNLLSQKLLLDLFWLFLLIISVIIASIIFSLVLLRLSVYFRDRYRANQFGVPEVVELIRILDEKLWKKLSKKNSVKLSFIGHSMGGFVVTNAVRILSDVFAPATATSRINYLGKAFCLERLILASPDIPVLTIISGRANFLATSLSRFSEAYLFSNQGDIVLRIAATAANYFSFPARTRESGYRLGNVAIKSEKYGIVNLEYLKDFWKYNDISLAEYEKSPTKILQHLFVSILGNPLEGYMKNMCSWWKKFSQRFSYNQFLISEQDISNQSTGKDEPDSLSDIRKEHFTKNYLDAETLTIAELFTFFDCTDYRDVTDKNSKPRGILTFAKKKLVLNLGDYLKLSLASFRKKLNVHGGYFQGNFSKQVVYRLAFLGFSGLLESLPANQQKNGFNAEQALISLDNELERKQIKVLLSPLRYQVDILRSNIKEVKHELLTRIAQSD